MNAFIWPTGVLILILYGLCQFSTLLHVLVLHVIKNDVALRRIGVEAGIAFLIVVFIKNNGIFAFGNIKIFFCSRHTQRIRLGTYSFFTTWQGIGVDGNKKVGFSFVRNIGTVVERNKNIGLTCENNFYSLAIFANKFSNFKSNVEINIFFFGIGTDGTGVIAAMSGVNN